MAGVACITVAPDCNSWGNSLLPSIAISRETIITDAPTISGKYSSKAAISNDIVVTEFKVSKFVPNTKKTNLGCGFVTLGSKYPVFYVLMTNVC